MMANWLEQITASHVRELTPYESARRLFTASEGQERIWLNANESPNANEYAINSEMLNRYPDCQPQPVLAAYASYAQLLPEQITEYPLVPFHFKWTGTPFPISAVSPLIGKQREMNKAHQLMIHNASLGSSLRWLHEEGSIDTDYWEQYSSAPGALLPVRPGSMAPTPVQPAPLSNAFFGIVNEGKQDMEY